MAQAPDNAVFFARLFGDGEPRDLAPGSLGADPGEGGLLWIDLDDPPDGLLDQVWADCGFPAAADTLRPA